ncbi:mannan-binding lectin serine protease 1 isoform X5 [Hypanus sabinus]|uniref:mannan-binding lectin serine protease 1 isoform X5 n=1 Tax=Hypanus sabinus TaxID=79690 RepID=UPI0028C38C08|nr:mannan-binding lectin serine protease 1 isoform X5 [Hypanus sabinus]
MEAGPAARRGASDASDLCFVRSSRTRPRMGCFWLVVLCFLPLCGGNVTELVGMFGQIQSPNYPEGYPSDTDMTWNITVPIGFRIKLYFMHFDLEPSYLCEYDYVKVTSGDMLETFCGRESTDTEKIPGQDSVLSTDNTMTLQFKTDFSNEERFTGFEAHYAAIDIDECVEKLDESLACDHFCHNYIGGFYCSCRFSYILHSDNRTCKVECSDNVFTERSGIVSSPDYPNPYPKSSDCLYRIELEDGFLITLEFVDIFDLEDHPDVDCPYDYLKIKAGLKEFGPFCGDKSPGRVVTNSSSVQVLFHTDDSGDNRGWKFAFTSVGSPCPVIQPPLNGQVEPVLEHYSFKDQIQIRCNAGFKFVKGGDEVEAYQIECLKSGKWSSGIPTCKVIDCGTPRPLEDGFVTFHSKDNLTLFGSQINYSCQALFYRMEPELNSTYTCMENSFWVNDELGTDLPTCYPVCGKPRIRRSSIQPKIAQGRVVSKGTAPWIAMLSKNGIPFCGGSLIGRQKTLRKEQMEQEYHAKNIITHPNYNGSTFEYDIALLELPSKVKMMDYVMPICLPENSSSTLHTGDMVIVSGWGKQFLQSIPETLMEIEIPIVDHNHCKNVYSQLGRKVTNDMICAGLKQGGSDACQGDSGGPMVAMDREKHRWFLVGTVSWGDGCGEDNRYGVYSDVRKSTEWIKNISKAKNI